MAEQALIEKISAEAAAEAARIKAVADSEIAAVEAETERERGRLRDAVTAELAKERQHAEVVALSRARQAAHMREQEAKRAGIDACFEQVFSELAEQPSERYVTAFTTFGQSTLPRAITVSRVLAPVAREAETVSIAKALSIDPSVIELRPDIRAGLMIYTNEGVFDITLERLMAEARPELEPEVLAHVLS